MARIPGAQISQMGKAKQRITLATNCGSEIPDMAAMKLRPKYVCFNCRKMFRLAPDHPTDPPPVCPQCGQGMVIVGRFFRPPRRTDTRRWRIVEELYRNGVRYSGYAGRVPTHRSGVKGYLAKREEGQQRSEGEQL